MRAIAVALFSLILMNQAVDAASEATADHWRALTATDVEAAYALLRDNHPAAVPTVGDVEFTSALAKAHDAAVVRVRQVTNYESYVATLGEMAAAMGDGHIWSHPLFLPRTIAWAGLVTAKRGPDWVVAQDDPKIAGVEIVGARIVSCDGKSANALARERLGFLADVRAEAAQVVYGRWLLTDNGNPFLSRPWQCAFVQNGRDVSLTLNWSKIGYYEFVHDRAKPPYGKAGYGVRPSGQGYWISIEELGPLAQAVIDAAKPQSEKLRAAPFVVVDLRGNSGGDDAYGRALGEVLYGTDYVAAILGPKQGEKGNCQEVFRASAGNVEADSAEAIEFRKSGDMNAATSYVAAVQSMKAALATSRALTGDPVCPKRATGATGKPPSLMRAKIFVLTDALCFSSCIGTVDYFRRLGAIQIGQATGADTHYGEVREIVLPSGLSTFSTLQAIEPDNPRNIGPFVPKYEYGGDIADTPSLEKWVADLAAK